MTPYLAETLISGEWITTLIVAIIGAIGSAAIAYKKGAASATETRLASPVPEVPTRKVSTPPSWDAHRALVDRVTALEHISQELRRDMALQYREMMTAGAERESRLSDKLDGIARGIHHRIDEILSDHSQHPSRK